MTTDHNELRRLAKAVKAACSQLTTTLYLSTPDRIKAELVASELSDAFSRADAFISSLTARATAADMPIDMLLFCPNCGEQHIDEAKPDVCETCGGIEDEYTRTDRKVCTCKVFVAWLNPPHKSHRCGSCNWVFRPADVPTNGVAAIKTKGERDQDARPRYSAMLAEVAEAVIEAAAPYYCGLCYRNGAGEYQGQFPVKSDNDKWVHVYTGEYFGDCNAGRIRSLDISAITSRVMKNREAK